MQRVSKAAMIALTVAALALTAPSAIAFPNGSGTCSTDQNDIFMSRTKNPGQPGGFVITLSSPTYTPGQPYSVNLRGTTDTFAGIMIFAEDGAGTRYGVWDVSAANIRHLICGGAGTDTVTHSSAMSLSQINIPWTAPASAQGDLTFKSVVLSGSAGNPGAQQFWNPADVVMTAASASSPGIVPDGSIVAGVPLTVNRAGGSLELNWSASCSGDASDYAVYVGNMGDYSNYSQLQCSTAGLTSLSTVEPAGSQFYLIVPQTAGAEGSYGFDGDGLERSAAGVACAIQTPGTCP